MENTGWSKRIEKDGLTILCIKDFTTVHDDDFLRKNIVGELGWFGNSIEEVIADSKKYDSMELVNYGTSSQEFNFAGANFETIDEEGNSSRWLYFGF